MTRAHAADRYRALRLQPAEPTDAPTWYVITVKAGKAMAVASDLAEFGYHVFCPLEVEWRLRPRHHRRKGVSDKMKHEKPLLGRYLFVGMSETAGQWRTVMLIDGMDAALKLDGRYWPVPAQSIEAMRDAYEAGLYDKTVSEAQRLSELIGQIVTIQRGPFAGFAATVTAASAKYVSAEIDVMGRKATVKMRTEEVDS
jgi:transcription antitermination factor NusG